MNFNNKVYTVVKIFGIDVWITETLVNTWLIILFLAVFSLVVNILIKNFKSIPHGFQNFIELAIESIEKMTKDNMGEKYSYFSGWFFYLFTFLLFSNLLGLVGLRPPTADLATTLTFALITFFLIHFMGIVTAGKNYFKSYFEPFPILFPINIIGEIATPISLSFRLFGNIFGGFVIMAMMYNLFPLILKLGLPGIFHIYFDVFSGVLQAFIFVILSMTFIKDKIQD